MTDDEKAQAVVEVLAGVVRCEECGDAIGAILVYGKNWCVGCYLKRFPPTVDTSKYIGS